MPMLKDSIGGTWVVVAKREEACRIVPSPPKVLVMSTFRSRMEYAASRVLGWV